MAKRSISTEPFLWALFGARGLLAVLRHPLTRVVLLALCVLALLRWAYRFRYTLYDGLQLKGHSQLTSLLCYGGAVVGSAIAAGFLLGPIPR
jgi:fumarate reductase subunit D